MDEQLKMLFQRPKAGCPRGWSGSDANSFKLCVFEPSQHTSFNSKSFDIGREAHLLNIDMWRGESGEDFSRPKWGIYRSIKEKGSLRAEEEKARFADFEIRKGVLE